MEVWVCVSSYIYPSSWPLTLPGLPQRLGPQFENLSVLYINKTQEVPNYLHNFSLHFEKKKIANQFSLQDYFMTIFMNTNSAFCIICLNCFALEEY